ncbi:MAG: hypothetical protein Q9171_004886 [Xanthocarpia ochracea]
MAQQHHYRMSASSSSSSSQARMTPSETTSSPSVTMLDISQHTGGDPGAPSSPFSELAVSDGARPTYLNNPIPDMALLLDQQFIHGRLHQPQNGWMVNGNGPTNIQRQEPNWPYLDPGASSASEDTYFVDQNFYQRQNHWMGEYLAQFEQAYLPGPRSSPTHVDDIPRHVPLPTTASPWSQWAVSHGQLTRDPPPQALLYDPATDLHLLGIDGKLFPPREFVEELDQDDSSGSSAYLADVVLPEDNIDPPPPPDPVGPPSQIANRNRCCSKKAPKGGGRRHQPLNSHSRHNAKITRQTQGQCWSCALQRNECEFENEWDDTCIGCKKKRKPSLIGGCIRIRLPDLTSIFIPASLAEMHDPKKLRDFTATRAHGWLENRFLVYLTWGHGFPPIKVEATEVEPKGDSILFQNQYRLNLTTNQYELAQVPSPPLGIALLAPPERRAMLGGYIEDMLQKSFRRVPEVCFRGDDCRVERDFLLPIFEYKEAAAGRAKDLVHQALKLVVLTFIMTHSLTFVENTRDSVYRQLMNPPREKFGRHTCARLLNKQIKFLLSTLYKDIMKDVLSRVQDTLRLSKKKSLWAPLFASIVILAMTTETLQVTVRCKEETDKQENMINQDDRTADAEIALMDEKFGLLRTLFHQGYRTLLPRGLNPLRSRADRTCLDDASQRLAAKANDIVEQYHTFLVARQVLPPPTTTNEPQTARLIAQFLLYFSPPAQQNQPQQAAVAASKQ